jgi:uncharacterized protein YvpB
VFFEIKIVVAGIVLLTAPGMYDGVVDQKAPFESAIAVDAHAPKTGSYDVDIPAHQAQLTVEGLQESDTTPSTQNPIVLDHQRVYFGVMTNGACRQLPTGAALGPSAVNLPRLSLLMKNNPKLLANARPRGGNFAGLKGGPVAAWLDLPRGTLQTIHSPSMMDEAVEFRPSERVAVLASQVFMTLKAGDLDCMVITPFGGDPVMYTFPEKEKNFKITFKNTMVEGTGQIVPGIGYDFELLYDLMDSPKDKVPPIPFSLSPVKKSPPVDPHAGEGEINTQTGVNCGPPGH